MKNQNLILLQLAIEARLHAIESILGPDYRLTLMCRYDGKDGGDEDILLSVDDLSLAVAALERMRIRTDIVVMKAGEPNQS